MRTYLRRWIPATLPVAVGGAACSNLDGGDEAVGRNVEQLQGGDATLDTTSDSTLDGTNDGNACRAIVLTAKKTGGSKNWIATAALTPPMQFAIPAHAYIDQSNAGQHIVIFSFATGD